MRIRDDLYGVVFVHTSSGSVALRAGEEVPEGVDIDTALVTGADGATGEGDTDDGAGEKPGKPRGRGRPPGSSSKSKTGDESSS